MVRIRELMVTFDQLEQQRVVTRLGQLSQDRTATLMVILVGGILTLGLVASTLYLIARSIAGPLVSLAKAVGSSPTGSLLGIPVLERRDEIGYLTRVMHQMGVQIQSHLDQVEHSEAALRVLNDNLSASESKYRGLVDNAPFGIFTTKGTEITFSNRYNQILAGLDPDHLTDPAAFRQWIHPEDRERVMSEFAQAVARNTTVRDGLSLSSCEWDPAEGIEPPDSPRVWDNPTCDLYRIQYRHHRSGSDADPPQSIRAAGNAGPGGGRDCP